MRRVTDFWRCLQHGKARLRISHWKTLSAICHSDQLSHKEVSDFASSKVSAMLYVIGLGLSDEKDITVKGLEVCPLEFG